MDVILGYVKNLTLMCSGLVAGRTIGIGYLTDPADDVVFLRNGSRRRRV